MIVLCKKCCINYPPLVIPERPDQELSNCNYIASAEAMSITSDQSCYCFTQGNEYEAYGVLFYKG